MPRISEFLARTAPKSVRARGPASIVRSCWQTGMAPASRQKDGNMVICHA